MEIVLDKQKLGDWVALLDAYRVYAPAQEDDIWTYQALEGASKANGKRAKAAPLSLDHGNTVHSPKKITFPQREVFFEFEQKPGHPPSLTEVTPNAEETVVFGVRPCDGKATTLMDKVFAGELEDKYYQMRRDKTAYVGLACNRPHSSSCFCTAVGGSP